MAGTIKTNSVQLGDSAVATQNFVLQTNVDGTAKLSRGNVGSTTQDILTIDAAGVVKLPSTAVPAFRAQGIGQSLVAATWTKAILGSITFDTSSAFAASKYTPFTAGYYQINGMWQANGTTSGISIAVYKNGSSYAPGTYIPTSLSTPAVTLADLVYMNGSSDYLELWIYSGSAVPVAVATFSAVMVKGV